MKGVLSMTKYDKLKTKQSTPITYHGDRFKYRNSVKLVMSIVFHIVECTFDSSGIDFRLVCTVFIFIVFCMGRLGSTVL